MSAHDAYNTTGQTSKDFEEVTRIHLGLQDLINDKTSSAASANNFAIYPGAKISNMIANRSKEGANLDSIGSINIVTKNQTSMEASTVSTIGYGGQVSKESQSRVLDLNRQTNFPLNI